MNEFNGNPSIVSTVASVPESVFALEGNSVTLIIKRNDTLDPDVAVWTFNQSYTIVRYYPHYNTIRKLRVSADYKDRVEFDNITLSLELKNLRNNDSGLYIGEINTEMGKTVVEYRLSMYGELLLPCKIHTECYTLKIDNVMRLGFNWSYVFVECTFTKRFCT